MTPSSNSNEIHSQTNGSSDSATIFQNAQSNNTPSIPVQTRTTPSSNPSEIHSQTNDSAQSQITEPSLVVTLDYNDLIANKNLSSKIEEAFGISGLGVLTVKNVPNLPTHRAALLPLAREFAILPDQVK